MISVYQYDDYRVFLRDFYSFKKSTASHFSHRYIESKTGLSRGHFSRLISGTVNLSDEHSNRFCKLCQLSSAQTEYFTFLVKYCQAKHPESRSMFYEQLMKLRPAQTFPLSREQYAFFQEPQHMVIHALVNFLDISTKSDLNRIGSHLMPPVDSTTVQKSLDLLVMVGLIRITEDGQYKVTHRFLATTSHPKEIVFRKFFLNSLTNAQYALDNIPLAERVLSSMTISLSEDCYNKVLSLLTETRQKINTMVACDKDMSRVYQLSMHLVPISKK